jgi:hypothetical protein
MTANLEITISQIFTKKGVELDNLISSKTIDSAAA